MHIRLIYDVVWGTDDLNARKIALANIAAVVEGRVEGENWYCYFGNHTYLYEWRIALVKGLIESVTVVMPEGQEFPVSVDGSIYSDHEFFTMAQNQIGELLRSRRKT